MHEKKRSADDLDEPMSERDDDRWLLLTLLDQNDYWPWSIDELIRDRGDGDEVVVKDAVNRLQRGGLVHCTQEGLIFPTRTAIYRSELGE